MSKEKDTMTKEKWEQLKKQDKNPIVRHWTPQQWKAFTEGRK